MTSIDARTSSDVRSAVTEIVADVRTRGEVALEEWSLKLDGAPLKRAQTGGELPRDAYSSLVGAIRRWHERAMPADVSLETFPGVSLERRWVPLRSVGVYVPKGLLSTLAMCAVPAQVAGVERLAVVTPPDGAPTVAAAAAALGIDEVWAVGGPHAIAALAYGTRSIERVDKIVGPGNTYVNEAKLLVSRDVAIDLPAGPTELVVVAGSGTRRDVVELELAAQAEHGPATMCRVIEVDGDADRALKEVETIAPEHVLLLGADAEALAGRIRNAGTVFVGPYSSSVAGDYATGANHVLPTGGRARAVGGLGIESFMKPVTVQRLTREGLAGLRPVVEALATAEGLLAHARAARR